MAIKDVFKVSRKTFFNPSAWLGYKQLKVNSLAIWGFVKLAITPAKPERSESFEEAMKRFKLSETDIKEQKTTYFMYAFCFALAGLVIVGASFYYLIHYHSLAGFLVGLVVSTFAFAQAFRFHFWYFQLKFRKLGCTVKEWLNGKPINGKSKV